MTDVTDDALGADPVEVWGLVAVAAEVEKLEGARDWRDRPFRVPEVCVANFEFLERRETEERRQREIRPQARVVGDVTVS